MIHTKLIEVYDAPIDSEVNKFISENNVEIVDIKFTSVILTGRNASESKLDSALVIYKLNDNQVDNEELYIRRLLGYIEFLEEGKIDPLTLKAAKEKGLLLPLPDKL